MPSIVFVPVSFALATGWLYVLSLIAPTVEDQENQEGQLSLKFPGSLQELKNLASLLQLYNERQAMYVFVLFCSAYLYKQTFAIPGSVFMNLLGGALFGVFRGFFLACLLTALGASQCFLLSRFFGKHYLQRFFPSKVAFLQGKIEENKDRLLYFLLFLRLFPMTPNWFLNMASPVVNIPLHLFFISVFIGLMPYNFMCVQTGAILADLKSLDDMFNMGTIAKLAVVAIVALLPTFFMKRSKKALEHKE